LSDRNSVTGSSGVQNRQSVGDGTRHQEETGKGTNWNDQLSGGVKVGIGVGGKGGGGGLLGAAAKAVGLSAGADAGYSQSYLRSDTTNRSDSRNTNAENSVAASDGINRDHSTGASVSTNDGTFHQSGSFPRSSQSESRSKAIEESLSKIESYNEQARHYKELSQSLEQHASFAESNGFNLSQDLRQDLARWYDKEAQSNPLMPALWKTDLNGAQEGLRNAAIGKWATQRSDSIERDIQSALTNPALADMKVQGVASEASIAGHYSGGGGIGTPHPVSTGSPDRAREDQIIIAGASELLGEKHRRDIGVRQSLRSGPKGPEVD
jgi:conjugal transfer mating pair stabilization protein TraG